MDEHIRSRASVWPKQNSAQMVWVYNVQMISQLQITSQYAVQRLEVQGQGLVNWSSRTRTLCWSPRKRTCKLVLEDKDL